MVQPLETFQMPGASARRPGRESPLYGYAGKEPEGYHGLLPGPLGALALRSALTLR